MVRNWYFFAIALKLSSVIIDYNKEKISMIDIITYIIYSEKQMVEEQLLLFLFGDWGVPILYWYRQNVSLCYTNTLLAY